MSKRGKRVCIFMFVVSLCMFMIVLVFQKDRGYRFSYSDTSAYFALANGELLELTGNGTIYYYDKMGKRKILLENSDIIFMDMFYQDGTYILSVHKDGRIGVCQALSFKEWEIANVPGAIKAELQLTGLMVLTENGAIYEHEASEFLEWVLRGENIEVTLQKNENLPKCKDFCLSEENSVLLTENGEVMIKGKLDLEKYTLYEKIECPTVMDRIYNAGNSILALSSDGHLYEVGLDMIVPPHSSQWFILIPEYKDVTFLCADTGWERMVLADTVSNVYYYCLVNRGKAAGVPRKKKIRNMKNVKKVILFEEYLYILGEDYLYIRKVPVF